MRAGRYRGNAHSQHAMHIDVLTGQEQVGHFGLYAYLR